MTAFASSAYGDSVFLGLQLVALSMLTLHYRQSDMGALVFGALCAACVAYLLSPLMYTPLVAAMQAAVVPTVVVAKVPPASASDLPDDPALRLLLSMLTSTLAHDTLPLVPRSAHPPVAARHAPCNSAFASLCFCTTHIILQTIFTSSHTRMCYWCCVVLCARSSCRRGATGVSTVLDSSRWPPCYSCLAAPRPACSPQCRRRAT